LVHSTENFASWWRAGSSLGKARRNLLLCLLVLTCGAWALTLYHALDMRAPESMAGNMAGMEGMAGNMSSMDNMSGNMTGNMAGMAMGGLSAAGWSLGGAVVFVAIWTVMMAAMMLPAAAPMIMIFASAQARRGQAALVPTWIFTAGYLLVWLTAGAIVYAIVEAATGTASFGAPAPGAWAPIVLGATLVVAGIYQFTPLKRVCLRHCRSPFAFVAMHWREGRLGAVRMGALHGLVCLGCCWALFAVLVAAGVMSLAWMLALTLVVFAEKVLPLGELTARVIGVALIAAGLALSISGV
jgi:predicted metal-binding membrane protein